MTEKIWDFIEKKKFVIFFLIITLIAIYARYLMIEVRWGDFTLFIDPWFETLKEGGGLAALSQDIGNYNMPYLTILAILTYIDVDPVISVKTVSIIFDFICAITAMKMAFMIFKNSKNKELISLIVYGIILFLPTVLLNSSYWGQADSIYVAFIMLSLLALLEEKYLKAFIWLGFSFAFKLQFMFILPLYILMYISQRKFPLRYFLIIPLVNIVLCIPAIIAGKPIMDCLTIYVNQAGQYNDYLSLIFPGVYNILFPTNNINYAIKPIEQMGTIGVIVTMLVFIIMAVAVMHKKIKFGKQQIIEFGLWSVMVATFLLPYMHERYLFAGDVLSIIYFLYNRDKIYVPIGISLISMYGYTYLLFGNTGIPIVYMSFVFLALIVIVTKDIIKKYFLDEDKTTKGKLSATEI